MRDRPAGRVLERDQQGVQNRGLRRPWPDRQAAGRRRGGAFPVRRGFAGQLERADRPAARIQQLGVDGESGGGTRVVTHRGAQLQRARGPRRIDAGQNFKVPQVQRCRRPQVDITENPRQTPEILTLEVSAVGMPVNLDRQLVAARLHIRREVELGRGARILRVADLFPVDPQVKGRGHPVESKENPPPRPIGRQVEGPPVGRYRIALVIGGEMLLGRAHHPRRVLLERVVDVGINRRAVAVQLDVGRHGYAFPP
jgi:hypothetical protein